MQGNNVSSDAADMIQLALAATEGEELFGTGLQKAVYLLLAHKVNPDADLRYYWYRHGPFFPDLQQELDVLIERDRVQVIEIKKNTTYKLNHEYPDKARLQHARMVLSGLTKYNTNDAVQLVYELDQPTPFQKRFKIEFMGLLSKASAWDEQPKLPIAWETLRSAQLEFPSGKAFDQVRPAFEEFVSLISAQDPNKISSADHLRKIRDWSKETWNVFSDALRIEHHSHHFDEEAEKWMRHLPQKIEKFKSTIEAIWEDSDFEETLFDLGDEEDEEFAELIALETNLA